jgi:hypothetical protein
MGRMSRLHKERRESRRRNASRESTGGRAAGKQSSDPIRDLEDRLKRLSEGEFELVGDLPPEIREAHLKDVLAFESVGSGTSLFQGLEANGVNLPPPDSLDDRQSAEKANEVLGALAKLGVFLIGFERMTPREFYEKLWHETLWEGCYVEKRLPGALTFIDVSHSMSRADWRHFHKELKKLQSVH